jgi:hypothetical protein
MQTDTLQQLKAVYDQFPGMCAEKVPQSEIDVASVQLGIPFPEDYQEFFRLFGGGHAGSKSVAGLRQWKFASRSDWNVIVLTEHFRRQHYPGADRWVIFSDDGSGNPIGFDDAGRVWISDHDSCEFVCIETSFECWLRRWALGIDSERADYLAQERWPDGITSRLRKGAA